MLIQAQMRGAVKMLFGAVNERHVACQHAARSTWLPEGACACGSHAQLYIGSHVEADECTWHLSRSRRIRSSSTEAATGKKFLDQVKVAPIIGSQTRLGPCIAHLGCQSLSPGTGNDLAAIARSRCTSYRSLDSTERHTAGLRDMRVHGNGSGFGHVRGGLGTHQPGAELDSLRGDVEDRRGGGVIARTCLQPLAAMAT